MEDHILGMEDGRLRIVGVGTKCLCRPYDRFGWRRLNIVCKYNRLSMYLYLSKHGREVIHTQFSSRINRVVRGAIWATGLKEVFLGSRLGARRRLAIWFISFQHHLIQHCF